MLGAALRAGTLGHKIAVLMGAEPRRLWTPAEIARQLRVPTGSVRKELTRLLRRTSTGGDPFILRVKTGLYRTFIDHGTLAQIEQPPIELHAVQISCTLPQNRGWGPPQSPKRGTLAGSSAWSWNKQNRQHHGFLSWQGRRVTVAFSTTTATIQVALEASQTPIGIAEFETFDAWLDGTLQALGLVWLPERAHLDNFELNQDYRRVAMGDARRFTIKSLRNAWAQLYQKDEYRMRKELRVHKAEDELLTAREFGSILSGLLAPVAPPAPPIPIETEPGDMYQ